MTQDKVRIAFLGECMVELSGEPLKQMFGGDTLNTALYLSRLTAEANVDVYYATALGQDDISQQMLTQWHEEAINTELVTRLPGKMPGLYMVKNDAFGERHFHYWRDSSAAKDYFKQSDLNLLEQAIHSQKIDVVYLSGISLAILDDLSRERLIESLTAFSQLGGKIVFDNNYRAQLWSTEQAKHWYQRLLPLVDIALITEDDDVLVWGRDESVQTRTLKFGCDEVVIKRGCEPCKVIKRENGDISEHYVQAEKVLKVIDTCAAGDSFAAGYLAARLTGQTPEKAAKLGHQLASIVIQHAGAIIPLTASEHLKQQ